MNENYKNFLVDVLITLHVNLRELKERKNFAEPEELSHIEAKILAYEEMLGILRDSANEFGINREEVGL